MANNKERSPSPDLEIECKRSALFLQGGSWNRLWPLSGTAGNTLVRLLLLALFTLQLLSVFLFLGDAAFPVWPWSKLQAPRSPESQIVLLDSLLSKSSKSSRKCHLLSRIYVYDLPPEFNVALLLNCSNLFPWSSFCVPLSNSGLGPSARNSFLPWLRQIRRRRSVVHPKPLAVSNEDISGLSNAWYFTDQFTGEVIFHSRILDHPCRTQDPGEASAFYVPYYAGLDICRTLWTSSPPEERDKLALRLLDWLRQQFFFQRSGGQDHFLMIGRISWDFRRSSEDGWGSAFFNMPGASNITRLIIERSPWDEQEMGVPYPTGFHPRNVRDLETWQALVKAAERTTLFSFAGMPRRQFPDDFRGTLLDQCKHAKGCRSMSCNKWRCEKGNDLMDLFLDSTFCLQPRGDSFSRRSIFDALIAGCIPVLFWNESAYQQYLWHLPEDTASYSLFISKDEVRAGAIIEDVLRKVPFQRVEQMQKTIIGLIPRLVYAGKSSGFGSLLDAFDVAIEGVFRKLRRPRSSVA